MKLNLYVCILIPILLWSSHSVFTKYILSLGGSAFEINFYRALGAILPFIYLVNLKRFKEYSYKVYIPGLFLFCNLVTFNYALSYIDAYMVMILEASCFVFSFAFDRLMRLQTKISKLALAFFVLGFCVLLSQAEMTEDGYFLKGLIFALVASVFFGFFNSTIHLANEAKDKTILIFLPSLILSLPVILYELPQSSLDLYGIASIMIVLGVLQAGAAMYFWLQASKSISGTSLSLVFLLTLPGTFLVEWLFIGFEPKISHVVGSCLIVLSILINIKRVKNN